MATTSPLHEDILTRLIKEQMIQDGAATVEAKPAKVKAVKKPKEPVVCAPGYKPFVEVFGVPSEPFIGYEMPVKVFERGDWDKSIQSHIPNVDEGFMFPMPETMYLVDGLQAKDKCLCIGPTGSGKSTVFNQIASRIVMPWIRVNMRQDAESSIIFGSITVKDGTMDGTTFNEGPACEVGRHGGILQIDEIAATPAGINMSMQWMLEKDGVARIYLADKPGTTEEKMIVPHPEFRIAATDNTELQGDTTGRYNGTGAQNMAMLDRFSTVVRLNYMEPAREKQALMARVPKLEEADADKIMQTTALVRSAFQKGDLQLTMSFRTMVEWAEKMVRWGEPLVALRLCFFDKLIESDRVACNEAVVHRVFGKNIQ